MKVPAFLLLFFALTDVFLTAYAIENWNAQEINPVARWLWGTLGLNGLLLGKFVLILLVALQLRADRETGIFTLWLCAIVQIAVVTITLTVHLSATLLPF